VPQKFKVGGTLKATYIPRRDIKMLTTVWGNNIRGKDLIDGAYTKRKNVKTAPKVARTKFEEETFEYKKGGGLNEATYIPRRDIKNLETVWGNNIKGKDLIDGAYTKRRNIKTAPRVARTQFEEETYEYARGGFAGVPEKNYLPTTNIYPKWVNVDELITDNTKYGAISDLSNELLFERMIKKPTEEDDAYRWEYENRINWYSSNFGSKSIPNSNTSTLPIKRNFSEWAKSGNKTLKKFATGSRISSDDTPKVWVG
jgi:hypothetical protein